MQTGREIINEYLPLGIDRAMAELKEKFNFMDDDTISYYVWLSCHTSRILPIDTMSELKEAAKVVRTGVDFLTNQPCYKINY